MLNFIGKIFYQYTTEFNNSVRTCYSAKLTTCTEINLVIYLAQVTEVHLELVINIYLKLSMTY